MGAKPAGGATKLAIEIQVSEVGVQQIKQGGNARGKGRQGVWRAEYGV